MMTVRDLKAVLDRYKDRECVGFCWDSGHVDS